VIEAGSLFGSKRELAPDSAQEAARLRTCPELKTWAECVVRQEKDMVEAAARANAVRERNVESRRTAIAAAWAAFDALPKKTKKDLFATLEKVTSQVEMLSPADGATARAQSASLARERMAPLIIPETRATGDANDTLVPSPDAAKCRVWASMWTRDLDTLDSLITLGFQSVVCGDKTTNLREAANVCYLRWKQGPDHAADDAIFVWKTLEVFERARVVGQRTDDRATLEYLGLVSRGADTMMPGGRYVIEDRGPGWVRISGRDAQAGRRGYVDEDACRRKP
jgi:hypothetical protein